MKKKIIGIFIIVMLITISLPVEGIRNNNINIETTNDIWLFHGFIIGIPLSYHEDEFGEWGITFNPLFIIAIGLFNETGYETPWLPGIRIFNPKYLIFLDRDSTICIINDFFVFTLTYDSAIIEYNP